MYTEKIIAALQTSHPAAARQVLSAETRFNQIPGMDSMSIVAFQMELAVLIGSKAEQIIPPLDMSIGEFSEVLETT